MKSRVNFHLLSRWSPILRAKLRKKLRIASGPLRPSAAMAAQHAINPKQLGLGLGTFVRTGSGISPEREVRFFKHQFSVLGMEWNDLPPTIGFRPSSHSPGYSPIDWRAWYGKGEGQDIKLPWELSRFHLLAEMAFSCVGGESSKVSLTAVEIVSQLRDFTTSNPCGSGAHWGCAMDVGLRSLNVIMAWELLHAAGWTPGKEESNFFEQFLREHGNFIYQNLEWYRVGRGNHYLANLVGLLACSLWLPADHQTGTWFSFSSQELLLECDRQFLADGSNFEGSVFYHRLSLELMALGYALLKGPAHRKGLWGGDLRALAQKIQSGLGFLQDLTDSRGHGVQFGDHDGGRALKLFVPMISLPAGSIEDALDTRDTLSLGMLFDKEERMGPLGQVALWVAGGRQELPFHRESCDATIEDKSSAISLPVGPPTHEFTVPGLDPDDLKFGVHREFGVYFWKCGGAELWLRCGFPSKDGHGGHAHFDQLHVELRIEGKPVVFDPGSFAYSGNREMRNFFRGPGMHFIPRLPEVESFANQSVDAFRYPGLPVGECLKATSSEFIGCYRLSGQSAFRRLLLEKGRVSIWDWSEGGRLLSLLPSPEFVSWGYGQKAPWPIPSVEREGSA